MEGTDVCMDKEPDRVITYSTGGVSHVSSCEDSLSHQDVMESFGEINGDHDINNSEEGSEAKEYEVKECTNEKSIKIPELHLSEKPEEQQNVISSNNEKESLEEKVLQEGKNDDKSLLTVKSSKSSARNARTRHTVPQPFALATEKRASCGTRPANAITTEKSTKNNVQPAKAKSNQVHSNEHNSTSVQLSSQDVYNSIPHGRRPTCFVHCFHLMGCFLIIILNYFLDLYKSAQGLVAQEILFLVVPIRGSKNLLLLPAACIT